MIRKFIIACTAVAVILGGFGVPGGALISMAEASGQGMAMSDCAAMMGMSGDQTPMDCGAMSDDGDENLPMTCSFKDCSLRSCSVSAFQITVSLVTYALSVGLPESQPEMPIQLSAAGKPPLPPPRSSILTEL